MFPGAAILGVLNLEAEGGELVAYLVAGGPVLVGLGDGTLLEEHVDNLAEGLLATAVVAALLGLDAEDIEEEEGEHLFQFGQVGSTEGGLLVDGLIDDAGGIEEVADDDGCVEVVVHGFVALLTKTLHIGSGFARRSKSTKCLVCLEQTLQPLLGSLKSLETILTIFSRINTFTHKSGVKQDINQIF